jgi:ribonuclease BN (tRNA processing enzyme)
LKETKLDPKKAIEFGVKPGPLLGLLAAGREIEINGRIIKPEMVTTKREKFIEVSKEIFKYI